MNASKRLPTLYIPHGGGPCFFMDPPPSHPHLWDGLASHLRGIDAADGDAGVRTCGESIAGNALSGFQFG